MTVVAGSPYLPSLKSRYPDIEGASLPKRPHPHKLLQQRSPNLTLQPLTSSRTLSLDPGLSVLPARGYDGDLGRAVSVSSSSVGS